MHCEVKTGFDSFRNFLLKMCQHCTLRHWVHRPGVFMNWSFPETSYLNITGILEDKSTQHLRQQHQIFVIVIELEVKLPSVNQSWRSCCWAVPSAAFVVCLSSLSACLWCWDVHTVQVSLSGSWNEARFSKLPSNHSCVSRDVTCCYSNKKLFSPTTLNNKRQKSAGNDQSLSKELLGTPLF